MKTYLASTIRCPSCNTRVNFVTHGGTQGLPENTPVVNVCSVCFEPAILTRNPDQLRAPTPEELAEMKLLPQWKEVEQLQKGTNS